MAQVPVTPDLCINLSSNTGFQNRVEMQMYNQCKWLKANWHTPANLLQQKQYNFAVQTLTSGLFIDRAQVVKRALAGMGGTVDDEYFEQEKLDLRIQILIEDMSNVLAGDSNLPIE